MQSLVDDAVARKAYTECAPLQVKLDALIKKRADLPTIDELKEAVRRAEEVVAEAAARRDFTGAVSAQAALDKAKGRLEDALRSEGADVEVCSVDSRFQSRAELEDAIFKVTKNVDNAIANKEFNKATKYQAELEELEGLRSLLPSIEELKSKLNGLKTEMDEAIKNKDFETADSIQKDCDELEAKIEEERAKMTPNHEAKAAKNSLPHFTNEKGENIIFESRYMIEEEINRFKSLVQTAANSKKFKEASSYQQFLDQLEEMKPLLPTAVELNLELTKTKAEMDTAIKGKDFGKAEQLNEVVEKLEMKFELEQKNTVQPLALSANQLQNTPAVVKTPFKPLHDRTNTKLVVPPGTAKVSRTLATANSSWRPVAKLRPKAPMISQTDSSVLAVTQLLASKRGDAAIITDDTGGLAGIITDVSFDLGA